ncbi:MAG: M23 family metallopeptidase [Candidatus Binatia bacterium]
MSSLEIGRPPRRVGWARNFLVILLIVGVVAGGYFVIPRFEWKSPQIKVTPDAETLGLGAIEIDITEQGTGLKSVSASLTAGGTEHALAAEQYDKPVMQKKITVALSSKLTGLKEGPAVLRISARDRSLWSFFRGNETVLQKKLIIDITPPTVELIADDPYINFGGAGLVAYKPSADTVTSGVVIGKHFFPGYKGQTKDPATYLAFFAHPYDAPATEKANLVATDKAGNTRQMALAYTLMNVKYRKSTISITDEFIQNKVAPLLNDVGARQGSAKDVFVKVNRDLRRENEEKIKAVTQKTSGSMLWSGPFSQLSNSKVEANFADARTYIYKDETIDHAYHLGFDLSVTKRYPVEAANSGLVTFVGDLGIYGNTVVLDHGLGLATLYSHLSSIDVKEGDQIKKQQIIGKTGETGLAAGDHLHYGVYLHGISVLPLEWWDEKWLRDNIYPKLESSEIDSTIEAKPQTKANSKKTSRRRR